MGNFTSVISSGGLKGPRGKLTWGSTNVGHMAMPRMPNWPTDTAPTIQNFKYLYNDGKAMIYVYHYAHFRHIDSGSR